MTVKKPYAFSSEILIQVLQSFYPCNGYVDTSSLKLLNADSEADILKI